MDTEVLECNSMLLSIKRATVNGFEVYQVWIDNRQIAQYWSEPMAQTRLAVEARKLSVKGVV